MGTGWANVFPEKKGLYDPSLEKDACGVGFFVKVDGVPSHDIVSMASTVLKNMEHRGAVGADPLDGDGAGIMTSMPHKFIKNVWKDIIKSDLLENNPDSEKSPNSFTSRVYKSIIEDYLTNNSLEEGSIDAIFEPFTYSTGNLFFYPSTDDIESAISVFEKIAKTVGLQVLGWRLVPTNNKYIGSISKTKEPQVLQPLIKQIKNQVLQNETDTPSSNKIAPKNPINKFERQLYLLRKISTKEISNTVINGEWFYACSLSANKIIYKGLFSSENLGSYYPDLRNPSYESYFGLVHSRFSTNTFPSWDRAQPFRFCAHNGEINTLEGNKNWMRSREGILSSKHFSKNELEQIFPIIEDHSSDSQAFDSVLELMTLAGELKITEAIITMVPEAWQNLSPDSENVFDTKKKNFYEWASSIMEPWDGPALLAFSDGRYCGAVLDRNGLRPCRYYITKDNIMVCGSEVGAIKIDPENIVQKGRVMPGKVFLVDTSLGLIIDDKSLKKGIFDMKPFGDWIAKNTIDVEKAVESLRIELPSASEKKTKKDLHVLQDPNLAAFGYSIEEINMLLLPMVKNGKEALGSMGNDAILPCLDPEPRLPYEYMRQLFAQVTNPPIDPIRESIVMSLECMIGPEHNMLDINEQQVNRIRLKTFLLSDQEFQAISNLHKLNSIQDYWKTRTIDITFRKSGGSKAYTEALSDVCRLAAEYVQNGTRILILSDRNVGPDRVSLFTLLAAGAVHHTLVQKKLRLKTALIVETGDAREVHHFCTLLGYGVDAIYPYYVYKIIKGLKRVGATDSTISEEELLAKYKKSINDGVKKVMSKMGVSTLHSYKGAQTFEALGISQEVVDICLKNTTSRIGGAGFDVFACDAIAFHEKGYPSTTRVNEITGLQEGSIWSSAGKLGEYHWNRGGTKHVNTPAAISKLQDAVRQKNQQSWDEYSKEQWEKATKGCTLRGLLEFNIPKDCKEISIEEVEPWTEIVKRFVTGAMSYGSISLEAHTALAAAMNKIGGKSNSGEGGEDPSRYEKLPNGGSYRSAIKQVASGRFGVTSYYLTNADEIQIKMAQGAKPGEGGELPGYKVTGKIAETRNSTEGVGLISPPPHHDIYSIEDLKQLIYDLKGANPMARISVKLVSTKGVGIVASGVAKAEADHILISGHDGGTGASRWTGIKYAGLPWEIGVAETHQTLLLNNLRDKVVVQTDGQIKTAKEVLIAAMLGADEFGFATTPLIALGCTMMRKCHLNTCPVGVATQDPVLREKFAGKPEHVINFFYYLAEDVRKFMASIGVSKFQDLVGKSEYLMVDKKSVSMNPKTRNINMEKLLSKEYLDTNTESDTILNTINLDNPKFDDDFCGNTESTSKNNTLPMIGTICKTTSDRLENKLVKSYLDKIKSGSKIEISETLTNLDRSFGATFSYYISLYHGGDGLPEGTIQIRLNGSAGQSFGAFLASGIKMELEGDSNDYVGKGLSGGTLIIYPPRNSTFDSSKNIIVGNVCLYGATSGKAFLNGIAAERFAVRNSGATAVVEGVGDHGCEYMTGGTVVILGETGRNFAAGMSGGIAYVLPRNKKVFEESVNPEMVELESLIDSEEIGKLKTIIIEHYETTGSKNAQMVLSNWNESIKLFIKVIPTEYKRILEKNKSKTVCNHTATKNKNVTNGIHGVANLTNGKVQHSVVDLEDAIPDVNSLSKKKNAIDKLSGFMKYGRETETYRPVKKRIKDWNEINSRLSKEKLKTQAARCMDCGVPFCQSDYSGCPIGNMIPRWNDLVFMEQWKEAFDCLMSTNNFPEFTGRVCPAPCEGACVLGINSDPVGIKSIEAAIIDYAWEQGWMAPVNNIQRSGKKVAIIGSGPAGLAAADQLNLAGYKVTVYEREDRVGGLLMYGIPNMKLDKKHITRRVNKMESEGVEFVTGVEIGKDLKYEKVRLDNDAVLLATGATWPRDMKVEGRELEGIHFAVEFLTLNSKSYLNSKLADDMYISAKGKNVIVIGGGDTGTDCIATSVRHGAESVTNFELLPCPPNTRAQDNPWPLFPRIFKVDYGHAEATETFGSDPRVYCISTKRFISDESNKKITGIETVRVEWEKDNSTGSWIIKEVPGSEKIFKADIVLLAMGFLGPEKETLSELGIEFDKRGAIKTDNEKYETNIPGVFAAGDCRRGQSLVVWGINEGRQAAKEIDQYLMDADSTQEKIENCSEMIRKSILPVCGGAVERAIELSGFVSHVETNTNLSFKAE
ncbi:hypothetical protein BB559_003634 [Furculomyces boomerangus]|uniref:glutamate synthase (NADH) n=1 Tax=Furculomyces boomerangus TaxID=61424 RepID=A0A2T9YK43_9FUNG|nr:hypothetical protein BB559_003634 [Furculomyces boomerangus]